jgi:hypothetical protein
VDGKREADVGHGQRHQEDVRRPDQCYKSGASLRKVG